MKSYVFVVIGQDEDKVWEPLKAFGSLAPAEQYITDTMIKDIKSFNYLVEVMPETWDKKKLVEYWSGLMETEPMKVRRVEMATQ